VQLNATTVGSETIYQMDIEMDWHGLLSQGLIYVLSLFCSIVIVIFWYLGLVGWFILTISLFASILASLVTNTLASWEDLPNQILLFITMVPVFELMGWINSRVLVGFFNNLTANLGPVAFSKFVKGHWNSDSRWQRGALVSFLVVALFVVVGVVVKLSLNQDMGLLPVILICSFAPPVFATGRVVIACWASLLVKPTDYEPLPIDDTALAPPDAAVSPAPQTSILDSIGFLSVADWLKYIASPDRSLRRLSWRLVPALVMLGVWIALVGLDITRHIAVEKGDHSALVAYLEDVAGYMCSDFCMLMCDDCTDSCTPNCGLFCRDDCSVCTNCTEFCAEKCAGPQDLPDIKAHKPAVSLMVARWTFGLRCALLLFLLPFLVWANPFAFDFAGAAKFHLRTTRVSGAVALGIGLAAIFTGLGLRWLPFPAFPQISSLELRNASLGDIPPNSMCRNGTLQGLAGVSIWAALARHGNQSSRPSKSVLHNLLVILGANVSWWISSPLGHHSLVPPAFIFRAPEWGQPREVIVALAGTRGLAEIAFFLENVVSAYVRSLMTVIVPGYRLTWPFFFDSYETALTETIGLAIAGPNRLSVNYWMTATWFLHAILAMLQNETWPRAWLQAASGTAELKVTTVVGHGCYGILAKGLAWQNGWAGVAFDSSPFFDSPVSIFQQWIGEGVVSPSGWTLDIYSNGSLQTWPDAASLVSRSDMMPGPRGLFRHPLVEKTFCLVAAGCATTNAYDELCANFLGGMDEYLKLFDAWDRPRARDAVLGFPD
jgi:hypothetical protein